MLHLGLRHNCGPHRQLRLLHRVLEPRVGQCVTFHTMICPHRNDQASAAAPHWRPSATRTPRRRTCAHGVGQGAAHLRIGGEDSSQAAAAALPTRRRSQCMIAGCRSPIADRRSRRSSVSHSREPRVRSGPRAHAHTPYLVSSRMAVSTFMVAFLSTQPLARCEMFAAHAWHWAAGRRAPNVPMREGQQAAAGERVFLQLGALSVGFPVLPSISAHVAFAARQRSALFFTPLDQRRPACDRLPWMPRTRS